MKTQRSNTTTALYLCGTLTGVLAALALAAPAPRALLDDCDIHVKAGQHRTISNNTSANCIHVEAGGYLYIASATLTLTGQGNHTTSIVDGCVVLTGSNSVLRIKKRDHTISGTGFLIGQHNSALIEGHPSNPGGLTVAAGFTIEGALKIALDLINNGKVRANDPTAGSDTLTIDSGTITGTGTFEVNTAGASLEFDATGVTATGLAADFSVSAGALDIDTNVTTTGDLAFTGGKIDVQSGATFSAKVSSP